MEKTITIDGREIRLRASAAIPRLYRLKFHRDIMQDMAAIQKELDKQKDPDASTLPVETLTMFENIAYLMALHGDPGSVPTDVNEWLDGFDTFSVYAIFPVIEEMWRDNVRQLNHPQKK